MVYKRRLVDIDELIQKLKDREYKVNATPKIPNYVWECINETQIITYMTVFKEDYPKFDSGDVELTFEYNKNNQN